MDKGVKRTMFYLPLFTALLVIFTSAMLIITMYVVDDIMTGITYDRMDESAKAAAEHIDSIFMSNKNILAGLSKSLASTNGEITPDMANVIDTFDDNITASRIRIITPDNKVYTSDGSLAELKAPVSFMDILTNSGNFTLRMSSASYDDQNIVRQLAPVYSGGKCVAIIYCTYVCDELPDLLKTYSYKGQGEIHIVDRRDGKVICDSGRDVNAPDDIWGYNTMLDSDGNYMKKDVDAMLNGQVGHNIFPVKEINKEIYISYVPSSFKEYEIVVTLDAEGAMSQLVSYRKMAYNLIGVSIVVFLLYFAWVFSRYQKMKYLYSHDQLTGALNRHGLKETFDKVKGNKVGVMIVDIDFFKKINDTYGHLNGDYVLKEMVQVINETIPKDAVVHRWGGEEFAIVYLDGEKALANAKEVHENIGKHEFMINGVVLNVTVSGGLVIGDSAEGRVNYDHLLLVADDRLYKAKNNGRNQIVAE